MNRYLIRDELNGSRAIEFCDTVSREISDSREIILNLKDATEIDVNGLAILVRLYSNLRARKVKLSVEDVPESIRVSMNRLGISRNILK